MEYASSQASSVAERASLSRKRQEENHKRRAIEAAKLVLAARRGKQGGKRSAGPHSGEKSSKRAKVGVDKENDHKSVSNRKSV
mmetsp:Transcript_83230/g.222482  ORF Transcript_83230/g.222482 Transcript_83230/m.222482 type:complete len:83 (-) Transcript_83230:121-369(-)